MNKEIVITFKWGTSKAQNTYGWTICRGLADNELMGKTCGGGYDLRGTAFANAMMKMFPAELLTLADRAHSKYDIVQKDGKDVYKSINVNRADSLYGFSVYIKDGKPVDVHLDGACGFDCIKTVMEQLGWRFKFIKEDVYLMTKEDSKPT